MSDVATGKKSGGKPPKAKIKSRGLRQDSTWPWAENLEFEPNENWDWWIFSGFVQSVNGCTLNEDTPDEKFYPSTFAWYATFAGHRAKNVPEGEEGYYLVQFTIPGEEGKVPNEEVVRAAYDRGREEFDTYADCPCSIKKGTCERHRR